MSALPRCEIHDGDSAICGQVPGRHLLLGELRDGLLCPTTSGGTTPAGATHEEEEPGATPAIDGGRHAAVVDLAQDPFRVPPDDAPAHSLPMPVGMATSLALDLPHRPPPVRLGSISYGSGCALAMPVRRAIKVWL
jgi:hypothetical protein